MARVITLDFGPLGSRSITASLSGTPTWMAASPIPFAAYMVSTMSAMKPRNSGSIFSTGLDTSFSRGSGALTRGKTVMAAGDR